MLLWYNLRWQQSTDLATLTWSVLAWRMKLCVRPGEVQAYDDNAIRSSNSCNQRQWQVLLSRDVGRKSCSVSVQVIGGLLLLCLSRAELIGFLIRCKVGFHNQRDLHPSGQSQSSSRSDEVEAERWNNTLGFHLIRVDGKHRESLPNICPPAKPTRWRLSVIESRVGRIWMAKQTNPSNSH